MRNRRKKEDIARNRAERSAKPLSREAIYRIFILIGVTLTLLVVYRFFMDTPYFSVVFWAYLISGAGIALVYVIYNRGLSRKNITKDMLPDSWSDEEKDNFISDGKRRLDRSKWMLIFIFAFAIVFAVDAVELFVLPMLEGLL